MVMMYRIGNGCSQHCHLDAGESCDECEYKGGKEEENYKRYIRETSTGQLVLRLVANDSRITC
jgi:hypothetical protein